MPPVTLMEEEEQKEPVETYSKPTIGIIYPPPEVRNIVDKTASFVARNGPEFESRIRQNEINNPKFNFLNPGDPYYAYFQYKVKDFREHVGKYQEPLPTPPSGLSKPKPLMQQQILVSDLNIPKDAPPEYEFVADPPSISAIDLDIVKLTAQFVARNGRQFLTNLMQREQRNYQFDFLRPQHSLFNYFTKLVEQYTKVLIPPATIKDKLKEDIHDPHKILKRVKYRVEWIKHQEKERQKLEDEKEKERVAFAQVDWHDFVVVETVEFKENETGSLPPPVTQEQLGARILAQERYEKIQEEGGTPEEDFNMDVEMEVDDNASKDQNKDMDMDMDDEGPAPPPSEPIIRPPPLPPIGGPGANIQIRRGYDPKAPKQQAAPLPPEKYLISPITGERVPASAMAEHMKINLLDPRWKEQRDKTIQDKKEQDMVFAEGLAIGSSLKQLAERRTDIFGAGDEETLIGRKIGEEEERRPEKVTWDGHTGSMAATSRRAQAGVSLDQQIEAIHKSKGLAPSAESERIGPRAPILPPPPKQSDFMVGRMKQNRAPTTAIPPPMMSTTMTTSAPPPPPMVPHMMTMNMPRPPPPVMQPDQQKFMQGLPPPPPGMQPLPPRPPFMNLPPAPPGPPPMRPPGPPPPSNKRDFEEDEAAAVKRSRVDAAEANLIPEGQFLKTHPQNVQFTVHVPNIPDKAEWRLDGRPVTLSLHLADQVSVIKAKIHDAIGMPAGKQKLQLGGIFIKDSNSLAYYNFTGSSVVQLQLKERGGRKK